MGNKWYTVGKLANTHGLRGEVKVLPSTDFPEERFAVGNKLSLQDEQSGRQLEIEITAAREQKGMFVLKLKGFNDINEVEKYKGWLLKIPEAEQGELEDGEYYYHQIIGCKAVTEDGEELGVISEILSPGANHVWVVDLSKPKGKQVLLPVIDDVILDVDVANKLVKVRLLEGLM
ncbi:ribosome maturation factor RimM [Paenibacillus radicis (ex Gao et al. 2016)]|uniref:Ribosome maturation factor RimM n=1 Tax=Paenibacillus radicis (ex Gao et al. 2016) TaxID=1737354 RepID=A0A917HIW2_9BACL|nr:ribosome maturation factor RimM [Paenibacillus radicis (ex Gao et al. 2016)]GGG80999.1 ribosome maturation factor RimM [Paenibacillus radicis (ex Gao et al. 2016)]